MEKQRQTETQKHHGCFPSDRKKQNCSNPAGKSDEDSDVCVSELILSSDTLKKK